MVVRPGVDPGCHGPGETAIRCCAPLPEPASTRVVEPGDVELRVGTSAQRETEARTVLVGPTWQLSMDSPRWTRTELDAVKD